MISMQYNLSDLQSTLTARKECIQRLCDAARDFLSFDINETLAELASHPKSWATPEMLIEAQADCEAAQQAIDRMEESLVSIPADFRAVMRAALMGFLESSLRRAEQERDHIQAELEKGSGQE